MLFGRTLRTRRAAQDEVLRLYSTAVSVERERVACELLVPSVSVVYLVGCVSVAVGNQSCDLCERL